LKLIEDLGSTGFYHIVVSANTGFDENQDWLNQPGRWNYIYKYKEYGAGEACFYSPLQDKPHGDRYWLLLPCNNQYVFANQHAVCIYDTTTMISEFNVNKRLFPLIAFGSIDSYDDAETEGNFVVSDVLQPEDQGESDGKIYSIALGRNRTNASSSGAEYEIGHHGLLHLNSNQFEGLWFETDDKKYSYTGAHISLAYYWEDKQFKYTSLSNVEPAYASVPYQTIPRWNNFCSRAILVKPILTVFRSTGTDEFVYPIGEFPWFASVHHPYYRPAEEATIGSRKFRMFPLLVYGCSYGLAIEVN